MKKVRFESPVRRVLIPQMSDSECHSPRPYMEKHIQSNAPGIYYEYSRLLPFNSDPVQRFEASNSSPYPSIHKTGISSFKKDSSWSPSNELELSMLDGSDHEPRRSSFCKPILKPTEVQRGQINRNEQLYSKINAKPLSSIGNQLQTPPNALNKTHDFFIRRDNLDKLHFENPVQHFGNLSLGKENSSVMQSEPMKATIKPVSDIFYNASHLELFDGNSQDINLCKCHHCVPNVLKNVPLCRSNTQNIRIDPRPTNTFDPMYSQCPCMAPPPVICSHCNHTQTINQHPRHSNEEFKAKPQNAVDKKTWAIERLEEGKKGKCMEVEKQTNIVKDKREPTVSDLFKIIKLQNEQLQLLQDKVDKFITANNSQNQPTEKYSEQIVHIDDGHKISIGVMTSFEMVRTSTIINKEIVKSCDNAQIQCNKSQISIKEVVSKTPVNLNFLEGISPTDKPVHIQNDNGTEAPVQTLCEEKTLNEQSLYNLQVDNVTTPMMSPDQTLYLDVRDYSDSDSGSDRSNVGWTYYNKVMTHVNGMLHDSDMPSSASAMCRNARQQCMQMQIDKTNVSVTKRVKFGDDPLGKHQPHIYTAPTDTSLKMNQLAAKYLKNGPPMMTQYVVPKPAPPIDMSFATRNYMERHRLLQGAPHQSKSPVGDIPRFLDVTALKQQPKFL